MARHKLVIPHPRLVKAKSGMWMVSFTHPEKGYTVKKSTGERDRTKAAQSMHAMTAEIVGLGPSNAAYTIGELLKGYESSKDVVAPAERYALVRLNEFFAAHTPEQLGDHSWKRYRKWRTGHDYVNAVAQHHKQPKKVSDSTACRELQTFRAAISWAQRSSKWHGLGHVRVVLPGAANNARQEFLTKEQARLLVDSCVEHHQRLFTLLALATAGRHRALLGLKWAKVTWPQGTAPADGDATFNAAVTEVPMDDPPQPRRSTRQVEWTKPKLAGAIHLDLGGDTGNKRKPIAVINPSNYRLYQALQKAYSTRNCEHVIEWRGEPVERIDLSDAYRRAGIPRPAAPQHILKHTAISWMVQKGEPLASIAALTRTSVQTIERVYGHLSPKHIELVGDVLTID